MSQAFNQKPGDSHQIIQVVHIKAAFHNFIRTVFNLLFLKPETEICTENLLLPLIFRLSVYLRLHFAFNQDYNSLYYSAIYEFLPLKTGYWSKFIKQIFVLKKQLKTIIYSSRSNISKMLTFNIVEIFSNGS
jgi:hypothetical protein